MTHPNAIGRIGLTDLHAYARQKPISMGPDSSEGKGKIGKIMVDIEANDKTEFQLNGYLWQKV